MKKEIILIIIILFILIVGLSGCYEIGNKLDAERNKFVGTWIREYEDVYGIHNDTMILFSDGTASLTSGLVSGISAEWELKDGKFTLITLNGEMTTVYNYTFSNNEQTLTTSQVGSTSSKIYTKQ